MKPLILTVMMTALVAGACLGPAIPAGAQASSDSNPIQVRYHGGALIQHAQVFTLFWGQSWQGSDLPGYFNGFFRELFADGRYMGNLSQYSAGGYTIGDGQFVSSDTDPADPPPTVTDAQIRREITAQIADGHLPQPGQDSLYFVMTPPEVVVVDSEGDTSANNFLGYHDYSDTGQLAYAVIPYNELWGRAQNMTLVMSHELAESVTDPQPALQELSEGGWYDELHGEIGDIPAEMFVNQQLDAQQFSQTLTGPDGTRYMVQAEWSNRDQKPVAFGAKPAPAR